MRGDGMKQTPKRTTAFTKKVAEHHKTFEDNRGDRFEFVEYKSDRPFIGIPTVFM
jgi:hypothetical protein